MTTSRQAFLISLPLFAGTTLLAQPAAGPLFPEAFRVTHHLVQEDGDGSRFVGEPVVDTYGGSWIVSQRPDGSRLVIDLVRRELTEVRRDKGVYWTVSFDRFGELQRRLRAAHGLTGDPAKKAAGGPPPEFVVTEVETKGKTDPPGVLHLRVALGGGAKSARAAESALDVWVDPSIRMTPSALAAVSALEADLLAAPAEEPSAAKAPGRFLAAARAKAAGALPVRTLRPAGAAGQVEDVATGVERLERFPSELVKIPEGLQRVPHPLEAAVRLLEEDAARNAVMARP
jgi:hypothetical protein